MSTQSNQFTSSIDLLDYVKDNDLDGAFIIGVRPAPDDPDGVALCSQMFQFRESNADMRLALSLGACFMAVRATVEEIGLELAMRAVGVAIDQATNSDVELQ
jgi:hypothetical protein